MTLLWAVALFKNQAPIDLKPQPKQGRKPELRKVTLLLLLLSLGFSWGPAFGDDDSGPPSNRVPMKTARAMALRKFPGKVRDFSLEIKKNKWVYFFKIAGKDQKFHNIVVDVMTDKIISKSSEPMPNAPKESAKPTPLANK